MTSLHDIIGNHKTMSIHSIKQYQSEVEKIIHFGGTKKETTIRVAFFNLLNDYAKPKGLMMLTEINIKGAKGKIVRPDGVLRDSLMQDWGYWESKDEADDLDEEIDKKFAKGYPSENILFEDSNTAVLIQCGNELMRVPMSDVDALDRIIKEFINFRPPVVENFHKAIELFKQDIPTVTETLRGIILAEEKTNTKFIDAEASFWELCKESINPEITLEDVREMMIQHILTEDIFNTIFDETQFHRENNIARELEQVILTFFKGNIKRVALGTIQHYYQAINAAAAQIADHHEKQKFLKVVYEVFYKGYNPKAADRLGVVYTPNEIVKFMIESTDYLLQHHFGKGLDDQGVEILDPATGTGTFICDIIDHLPKAKLAYKYKHEIHANEIAILPYYIANLNIEYTYKQKMGEYSEFESLCFVDTLDNLGFDYKGKQHSLFGVSAENAERIKRQNEKKISVIIGNPPYNAKQENYNYQNANKAYAEIDKRIRDTFIKHGTAQNQIVVYDMYTRFYRWAIDRLQDNGVIAFVTNRSFIDGRAFDGFRKIIASEFNHIYIIDLGGDVRVNPKLSGTKHNVFGIQTGVAIMLLVRKNNTFEAENAKNFRHLKREYDVVEEAMIVYKSRKYYGTSNCRIQYIRRPEFETGEDKLHFLATSKLDTMAFETVAPDVQNNWINNSDNDFADLMPLVSKDVKAGKGENAIFKTFSSGIKSQRDEWVYDFSSKNLGDKVKLLVDIYQKTMVNPGFPDKMTIKWDRELDKYRELLIDKQYDETRIVSTCYRPFVKQFFYFDKHLNGQPYQWFTFFKTNVKNTFIAFNASGSNKDFHCLSTQTIIDLHYTGDSQCIPLYCFDKQGNRLDNITDWGLQQFQNRYRHVETRCVASYPGKRLPTETQSIASLPEITKENIFHYVYAVLHNPAYRTKYELNLKRDFPRIPFYEDFHRWAAWGKALMELHIGYETVTPYPLGIVETRCIASHSNNPIASHSEKQNETETQCIASLPETTTRTPKPKLKADKETGTIILDEDTQLTGIPPQAWLYKLGNRSALEWVLDQYKEKKPSDPTIAEKFNTYRFADYKTQVIDLLKRVCTVSVETMKIVGEMKEA